jgi:hypothetical protein
VVLVVNGRTSDRHAAAEVADLIDRLGSLLTDLEDVVPEALTGSRRELLVAEQLLDRAVAHAERLVMLHTLSD